MDLDRDVVALSCPLGGFRHFEPSTNQINTELALKKKHNSTAQQLFQILKNYENVVKAFTSFTGHSKGFGYTSYLEGEFYLLTELF